MTQEELMKDLEDKEKDTLDTYTQGYTEAIDALDKGYADVGSALDAGQTMLENANKEQLDYTIDEIERQKAQTQKDYEKEQKAAFVDYQKQVDPYGVNAEKMVSAGLDNSGFAESSKVAMYNQYQQRVAVARESMQKSIAEYNASMTQARVSNSVAMAQLAYETLMKKMQYTTEHMLKRNDLLLSMTEGQVAIKQNATNNWLDTLGRLESGDLFDGAEFTTNTDSTEKDENNGFLNNIWQFFKPKENEQDSEDEEGSGGLIKNAAGWIGDAFGGTTYDDAYSYLEQSGASDSVLSGLATRREWRNNKSQYGGKNYQDYLSNYIGSHANSGSASKPNTQEPAANAQTSTETKFSGSTYDDAKSYLKSRGADDVVAGWLMTEKEWKTSALGGLYKSYQDYLNDFVRQIG